MSDKITHLQTVLAYASRDWDSFESFWPHHPITCRGDARLWLETDGRLRCPHGETEPHDERTQSCINHSIALLLVELADRL